MADSQTIVFGKFNGGVGLRSIILEGSCESGAGLSLRFSQSMTDVLLLFATQNLISYERQLKAAENSNEDKVLAHMALLQLQNQGRRRRRWRRCESKLLQRER